MMMGWMPNLRGDFPLSLPFPPFLLPPCLDLLAADYLMDALLYFVPSATLGNVVPSSFLTDFLAYFPVYPLDKPFRICIIGEGGRGIEVSQSANQPNIPIQSLIYTPIDRGTRETSRNKASIPVMPAFLHALLRPRRGGSPWASDSSSRKATYLGGAIKGRRPTHQKGLSSGCSSVMMVSPCSWSMSQSQQSIH